MYKNKADLAYYLTLFKIEGHETWRASLSPYRDGFDREWSNGTHPKVTHKKVYVIDRITGGVILEDTIMD